MKTFYKNSTILSLVLFTTGAFAQSIDTTMLVNGVCGMCQEVIEDAANELEGVSEASWDKNTKVLQVSYDTAQVSLLQISAAINESGYDTEFKTAPDEAYEGLHKCCYYRDPKVIAKHKEKQ